VVVVNWAIGPEDAQFYTPETDETYETFLKIVNDDVVMVYHTCTTDGPPTRRTAFFDTVEDLRADTKVIAKESK
ncbi:hypothetical protein, partial [Acinetobacter baumannii]|uniref:hypothetical protein n=1 Tax=Acinetobacter baumannii TaxID=470 RepID=UPI0028A159D6